MDFEETGCTPCSLRALDGERWEEIFLVHPRIMSEKKDDFEVFAQMNLIGDDLLVVLWGGTRPHIGAIGMAQPRPSLEDSKIISATSSVFTFSGHKEDVVAKAMSEELARKLKRKVVVVAGMHWEGLQDEGIEQVMEICQRLKEGILKGIGGT